MLSISLLFSQDKKNKFLGFFSGNIIPYLKEATPYIKIKDIIPFSYAIYKGHVYIYRSHGDYAKAYILSEEKAYEKAEEYATEKCKKYRFSVLDNYNVKIVEIKNTGLLFIFRGNIICLDF